MTRLVYIAILLLIPLSAFGQKVRLKVKPGRSGMIRHQFSQQPLDSNTHARHPIVDRSDTAIIMNMWGDECEFKVRLHDKYKCSTYVKSNIEFEWEIILDRRPRVNVFSYGIETKGLIFHRQPLDEEGPDSIKGSYAVYHSGKRDNRKYTDGSVEAYGTGKAFHIYRPKAFDSNNDTVWCELSVSGDSLYVAVSQEWLRQAAYPVVIDPTFGYTTAGGYNAKNFNDAGHGLAGAAYTHTAASLDTALWIHAYVGSAGGDDSAGFVLYSVSGTKGVENNPDSVSSGDDAVAWDGDDAYATDITSCMTNGNTGPSCEDVTADANYVKFYWETGRSYLAAGDTIRVYYKNDDGNNHALLAYTDANSVTTTDRLVISTEKAAGQWAAVVLTKDFIDSLGQLHSGDDWAVRLTDDNGDNMESGNDLTEVDAYITFPRPSTASINMKSGPIVIPAEMGIATTSYPSASWDSVAVAVGLGADTVFCLAAGSVEGTGTVDYRISYDIGGLGVSVEHPTNDALAGIWSFSTPTPENKIYSMYVTLNGGEEEEATGPPNVRHGPDGSGQRHGPDGASTRHEP